MKSVRAAGDRAALYFWIMVETVCLVPTHARTAVTVLERRWRRRVASEPWLG